MQKEKTKFHKAKKSLGQNFLKSVLAINKIIEAGEIKKDDIILEIGPGKGVLTEKLLEKTSKVIAVEKDKDLIEILSEKFKEEIKNGKLILLNKDILEILVNEELNLFKKETESNFLRGTRISSLNARPDHHKKFFPLLSYKIIANIPYNITGAILEKFLTEEHKPERMVLMVQKEVAERIVAKDKKESLLSISVKLYGNPTIIMKVPKRYFSPSPKVDSAVILISDISNQKLEENKIDEKNFWEILHRGFAHKRKILLSNLKKNNSKIDFLSIFEKNKIKDKARAEELSLANWISIIKDIN